MTSSEDRSPNYGRRILWLGIFVVVLFAGYSAAWFYFARTVADQVTAAIAGINRDGVTVECTDPSTHGFPFRIGVYCDQVAFADATSGIGLTAGSFRSAGQIYDLRHLIAELDGPARLDLVDGRSLAFVWDALRASVRLAEPLPERVSVEGRQVRASLESGAPLAEIGAFEAHMRANGQDIDLAGSVDGLVVDQSLTDGRSLPKLSSRSDLTVTGGVALIDAGDLSLRGKAGTIRTLTVSTGPDTGLELSGPFSISGEGLLDADLQVTIRDPKGLSAVLEQAFPEARSQISSGFSGLAFLGKAPSLPLKVVKGRAMLGFIPLGDVPPL